MRHVLVKRGRLWPPGQRQGARRGGWVTPSPGQECGQPPKPETPGGPSACVAGERACRHLDLRHPAPGRGGARLQLFPGQACDTLFQQPEKLGKDTQMQPPAQLPPLGWARDSARQTPGPLEPGLAQERGPQRAWGPRGFLSGVTASFLFFVCNKNSLIRDNGF